MEEWKASQSRGLLTAGWKVPRCSGADPDRPRQPRATRDMSPTTNSLADGVRAGGSVVVLDRGSWSGGGGLGFFFLQDVATFVYLDLGPRQRQRREVKLF